ncbi:rhodanese-like domain-containing protein [Shewanella sp. WXL01]|uniref:Rhodanese-like domain-containing protein n=1 Tax=Shewanella maritima TaxID=2520507 RepID=A0A411PI11_9GAMM|nr:MULTISPECIES: rhodanese-like domain-containing protein [Shewanella]NKF51922.1 rhodanese-like domain-containing protein [Shewanella sp. WXL01]QBF83000.1 rhodanese-like domain-containing protein [Shewanella maritima]
MKNTISILLASLLSVCGFSVSAGGGGDMQPVHQYEHELQHIGLRHAELLLEDPNVMFFDVNTLELWGEGYIPGAIFFNVSDWKALLPEKKDTPMVFYCANRLCNASEIAAHEALKLGYTQVMRMHEGIYGWRLSGRPIEKP